MKRILIIAFLFVSFIQIGFSNNGNYLIKQIKISGNYKTKNYVILQELSFKPGDNINSSTIENVLNDNKQRLNNLNIFGYVDIEFKTVDSTHEPEEINILIDVKEKWTLFPFPSLQYDNLTGYTIGISVSDSNFLGRAQSIGLSLQYNTYNKLISSFFQEPRLFGSKDSLYFYILYNNYIDTQITDNKVVYKAGVDMFYNYMQVLWAVLPEYNLSVYADSNLDFKKNSAEINLINKDITDSFSWITGSGIIWGAINRYGAVRQGNMVELWGGISPVYFISPGIGLSILNKGFYELFNKSVFGYRLEGFYYSYLEKQLNNNEIRGIIPGEIRGNYGFYGNIEFRPYIFTLPWPTPVDFYFPVFFDFANAFISGTDFDIKQTVYSGGMGIRLYPTYIAMVMRIDFAFNINKLILTGPGKAFFVSFNFSDMF